MLIPLFLFLILLFTWCVLAGGIWHYAIPGLRTGVLQARGRTYSRAGEPGRFWMGIVFWIGMFIVVSMVLTGAAAEVVGLFAGRP